MEVLLIDIGNQLTNIGWVLIKYVTIPIVILFILGIVINNWHTKRKLNR